MIYIGIDPGTKVGIAQWNPTEKKLIIVETMMLHRALEFVLLLHKWDTAPIKVFIENPNLRKWYGANASAKQQGAGSIKRDYSIWFDFLTDYGIPFESVDPKHIKTKITPEYFAKLTGWTERTSSHGRDAAMMVLNRK